MAGTWLEYQTANFCKQKRHPGWCMVHGAKELSVDLNVIKFWNNFIHKEIYEQNSHAHALS